MPTAVSQPPAEPKLGVSPAVTKIDPKTRKMMYRAKGVPPTVSRTWDIYIEFDDGSVIIDAMSGAAVNILGFGNQYVIKAMEEEMHRSGFVYGAFFSNTAAEQLSEYLIEHSNGDFAGVNFIAGGSEATESALKTAKQYWMDKGRPEKSKFIGREMSYHGNTIAGLSIGNHQAKRAPFATFVNHDVFHWVSPANYFHYGQPGETEEEYATRLAKELEDKILALGPETVAAFMFEPMVASSQGAVLPPKTYFTKVREVCDKYDVLVIYDEIMCGMWRLGRMFSYTRIGEGTKPDILVCAKGLGGGYVPIGAILANQKVVDALLAGSGFWNHGFTYTAFGLSCAGALAVQKYLVENNLTAQIDSLEVQLAEHLKRELLKDNGLGGFVIDVRGAGLLWAVEVLVPNAQKLSPRVAHRLQAKALEFGLATLGMPALRPDGSGDCLMLAPPGTCTPRQMETICDRTIKTIKAIRQELVAEGVLEPYVEQ